VKGRLPMNTLFGSMYIFVPGRPARRLRSWFLVWIVFSFECFDFPFDTFMVRVLLLVLLLLLDEDGVWMARGLPRKA